MLLRKDLEIIFSSPEIKTDLAKIERLYHKRFNSEQDKINYTQAFTRFRAKVENIKSGNMHYKSFNACANYRLTSGV